MPPGLQLLTTGARSRFATAMVATLALMVALPPPSAADKPTAQALITDRVSLPLSNQFTAPGQIRLTDAGDVFFTPGGLALFHWEASSGNRTRLLQASDPYPGFPDSTTDIVGNALQVNAAGHAAMVNFFAQQGAPNPRGVFVYDGTGFQKVALRGEVAPGSGGQLFLNFQQLRINDNDQVAFVATFEPLGFGTAGLFIGSPTGPPVKVALIGEAAPGTGGGTYNNFQLIGFNNAGQVAFLSDIGGGATPRAVFIGTTSGISKVAASGDLATGTAGTFDLLPGVGNYALNASGNVAFRSLAGPADGIWIGDAVSAPAKLLVIADATGTALGGTFGGAIGLRGFNAAGTVLFQSNPIGATSNHALFLKDLSSTAQVVYARGQAAPGGTTEVFFNTRQATLNDNGDVAFQAALQGGPAPFGWFLGSGTAPPVKVALQGDPTPAGGTFGLAGQNAPAQINGSGQVAFSADILGPNAIGAFLFTPGGGIVSTVNTNDTLPAGANPVIRPFMPGASDDQLLFVAFKAGGRSAVFTKPLHPGGGQITRRFGEGDAAPGLGGAMWNLIFNFGLINDSEEVAFATNVVVGASVYPASIIFTHKPGVGLQKVAATGDPAPGAAGGTFANFDVGTFSRPPARINSSGQVAFLANIATPMGNRTGVFIGAAGGIVQAVARQGDPSPVGGMGSVFGFFQFPLTDLSLNDAEQVAFRAVSQVGMTQIPALFVGSGAAPPVKVVAQGDAGPGGGTVSSIPIRLQMNNAGRVAYVAGLSGGSSSEGIFLGTAGGAQQAVALAGNTAPGTSGGTFSDFAEATIELNNPGQVAFWATVAGSSAGSGYFLGSATAAPVARLVEGQALPGGGVSGFVSPGFNNFIGENFSLTDSGEMSMFVSTAGAPNRPRQVIAGPTGALRQFITVGEKATGTGSEFGSLFQSAATNSDGRFFVTAILVDGPARWGVFWNK